MSSQALPRTLSVRKAITAGSCLSGRLELASLARVAGAVLGAEQPFGVELVFAETDGGKWTVHARVDGLVQLECQRCLQPVTVPLSADSLLTIVAHDAEARARLRDVEPLLLQGDELDVFGLVEDEILLALPIVALHDSGDCRAQTAQGAVQDKGEDAGHGEQESSERRKNPFAVLQ
ncbi:MAG: YceD family protein, partial [Pseudomonadales bacterium]